MKAHEMDRECTFQPDIGNSRLVARRSKHSIVELETPEERAVRLSFKDKVSKQIINESLLHIWGVECTLAVMCTGGPVR